MIDISFHKSLITDRTTIKDLITKIMTIGIKELKIDINNNIYISVLVTDDNSIKKINKKFRKINKPTNVLSFPNNDFGMKKKDQILILGDIVISLEKIYSESEEQNKKFSHHLSHIIIHGLLHLIGYDHEDPNEAMKMEKKEEFILSKLSIPSPYRC